MSIKNIENTYKLIDFLKINNDNNFIINQIEKDLILYRNEHITWDDTCIKSLLYKITG